MIIMKELILTDACQDDTADSGHSHPGVPVWITLLVHGTERNVFE